MAQFNVQLRQHGNDRGAVLGGDAAPVRRETDRAVDSAGIYIDKTEFFRAFAGDRALARAGGPVDGNGYGFHSVISFSGIARPAA